MKIFFENNRSVDTDAGIDISIPLKAGEDNVNAWYVDPVSIEPVMTEQFTGDVNLGGSVNFRNIALNPHGNGTHTECVGHISKEFYSLNQCLKSFHFFAGVITVTPIEHKNEKFNETDLIITGEMLKKAYERLDAIENIKAIVIRTYPNDKEKLRRQYSNSNPPYLTDDAMEWINAMGFDHLLIDLPSVDRELDHGKLSTHHLFWDYPKNPQLRKTITEMIYVPDEVADDIYFLNIQITSLENDASPSKIMLYGFI